jgi:hypothetical protein
VGGAINGLSASFGAILGDDVIVDAGDGGDATGNAAVGGIGGTVAATNIAIKAGAMDTLRVSTGAGGDSIAAGANGGDLSSTKINLGAGLLITTLTVNTGPGGSSETSNGGTGGKFGGLNVTSAAQHFGATSFDSGAGGATEQLSTGGNGGIVSGVVAKFTGAVGTLNVRSGAGGASTDQNEGGTGGNGGLLEKVTLTLGGVANENTLTTIRSGNGGQSDLFAGGDSGEIKGVKVTDNRLTTTIRVQTGNGGSGTASGGDSANLGGANVVAPNGVLELVGGDGGDATGVGSLAGIGGTIAGNKAKVNVFQAIAGDGGESTNITSGTGGAGGAVNTLNVTAKSGAQQIRAGAGGDGLTLGGAGGGVTDVKVVGDIGDFFRPFGIRPFGPNPELDMGGLFAGMGGSGTTDGVAGSITNVSAKRIASIIAVNDDTLPNNLGADNAVAAISGIKASVIGADLDGDGLFDFNNIGGTPDFDLNSGDQAVDGLVIVKTAGVPAGGLKPAPLLIITV